MDDSLPATLQRSDVDVVLNRRLNGAFQDGCREDGLMS